MLSALALLGAIAAAAPSNGAHTTSLARVLAHWDQDEHPDLKAVVVMRAGRIVAERYYNGERVSDLHDVRSAGKSITSLLAGAAVDRGKIGSINEPVEHYWSAARGTAIGHVPISDVLTMRSGLAAFDEDPESPGGENRLDAAANPRTFILGLTRVNAPGTVYRYNSVTAHVAGLIVQEAVHKDLQSFAKLVLFAPLGISRWTWERDAAGDFKGQGNLSLTARDFAKIGELVRERGTRFGRQVISAEWIDEALKPRVSIADVDPYADGYGYFWYSKMQQIGQTAVAVSFASGNGGNKVYVVRQLGLVVVITSGAYGKGYGQKRSEEILRAVLAAELGVEPPSEDGE